jgi:predicted SAM-dependent methyltransferase
MAKKSSKSKKGGFQKTPLNKLTVKKEKNPKKVILDLGCGDNKVTTQMLLESNLIVPTDQIEIIGVDNQKCPSVDKIHDLTKFPYPFKDNSVDVIYSSHFVEHLTGEQRIKFYNEIYRILKPGCKIRVIHPYYKSSRAVQDPTHQWPPICEESYLYWTKDFREVNKLGHYLGDCNFTFQMFYTFMDNSWLQKNEETRNHAIKHYFNVVADMIVDLTKA